MLPGKVYTPEEVLRLLWCRKWLVIVPFAAAVVCTFFIARQIPDRYRSESLIQVMPQRIPDNIVKPLMAGPSMEQRLVSLQQVILSRSQLERIIEEFDLYPDARRMRPIEEVVERMRTQDVTMKVERGDAFRVSYVAGDAATAKKVTERLASLFVDQNTVGQIGFIEQTTQFLDARLEEARLKLVEHEKKLEAYRRAHAGELPSQVQTNLQVLQNTQMQLQSLADSTNRDRERRLLLERQIADLESIPAPALMIHAEPSAGVPVARTAADELAAAEAALKALQVRYTGDHPDVAAVRRRIRDLQAEMKAENSGTPISTPAEATRPVSASELARQQRLRELRGDLQNLDRQIAAKDVSERQLRATLADYGARVAAAPTRESELIELTRDYGTLQDSYNALRRKREDAALAEGVVRQQIGEQFRILDPARVPERPFSPNRLRIVLLGSALGIGLGLMLIAFLEYRDSTFKTEAEVSRLLQLPVLALVPMMASEREVRARRRRKQLAGLAAMVMVVISAAAVAVWKLQGF